MKIIISISRLDKNVSLSNATASLQENQWYMGKLLQDYHGKPAGSSVAFKLSRIVNDIRYVLFDSQKWWEYLHKKEDPIDKIIQPIVVGGKVATIQEPRSGLLTALLAKLTANSPKLFKRR